MTPARVQAGVAISTLKGSRVMLESVCGSMDQWPRRYASTLPSETKAGVSCSPVGQFSEARTYADCKKRRPFGQYSFQPPSSRARLYSFDKTGVGVEVLSR